MNRELPCDSVYECDCWLSIFRQYDVDGDGYIPTNELKNVVRRQAYFMGLRPEEATKLLMNVDTNKDHLVDFSEFCAMMSKAKSMYMKNALFFAAKMVVPKGVRTEPFSYLQQYNCFPPPLFMLFISVIEIAIYVYYAITMETPFSKIATEPEPVNSILIFDPKRAHEAWRYLTYMFIHIGVIHLIFNVLTQIILGIPLELVHKQWRVCTVYLFGVLAGSLFSAVLSPKSKLAGASAGVYALLAAHISELLVNWAEMEYAILRAIFLILLIASDFGYEVYMSYFKQQMNRISFAAHLAGFAAGILMGVIVLRNFKKRSWERVMWWIAVTLACFLFATLIVLNIAPNFA